MTRDLLTAAAIALLLLCGPARAQVTGPPAPGVRVEPGMVASAVPAPLREIGFDQHIDQDVPLDTVFRDETGQAVRLGQYFGARPVLLAFVYYDCPMLCTQVLSGLTNALNTMSLTAGRDFEVVIVSFDPRETPALAAERKAIFVDRYNRPGTDAGWHFLTGDAAAIVRLTTAAGFRYAWDEATQQFAHPSGLVILTPDGRLARYLFGLDYSGRDVRFALVEASEGRVGSAVDAVLLYCYHYDPMKGRYGFIVMRALRIAGAATVLALAAFVFVMVRREKKGHVDRHSAIS
jgi:protein SCO1/2